MEIKMKALKKLRVKEEDQYPLILCINQVLSKQKSKNH